ncbi:MAG TPA: 2OG-Fe(II) oxygenase [Arenicellales bacterium]|nr:2OG-Fe(II) oxygenase [Arenicellales bacterium]
MGRHTVLRFWESELPADLCELILAEARQRETTQAGLRPDAGEDYVDESIRRTGIFFWDPGHWISGLTMHYARLANAEIWNYTLSVSQGVQFGRYGEGGTYDWHKDEFDQPFGDEAPEIWRGQSRKLSVAVNLSPPDDYEGGELLFKDTWGQPVEDAETMGKIRQQGSVVVFPSYIVHTVTPVTRGTRCSLVSWILGPPFA